MSHTCSPYQPTKTETLAASFSLPFKKHPV
jgi:hypothetical protein